MNWPVPKHNWTDERIDLLRKLLDVGKSASQIARTLGGVTRNAVIGKARRLNIGFVVPIGKPKSGPKPRDRVNIRLNTPPKFKPVAAIDLPPEPVANPVTLMQLTEHTCRYPVSGEPRDMLFCGAVPAHGKPYCNFHCAQAFAGYGQSMSRAERELALRASRKAKAA